MTRMRQMHTIGGARANITGSLSSQRTISDLSTAMEVNRLSVAGAGDTLASMTLRSDLDRATMRPRATVLSTRRKTSMRMMMRMKMILRLFPEKSNQRRKRAKNHRKNTASRSRMLLLLINNLKTSRMKMLMTRSSSMNKKLTRRTLKLRKLRKVVLMPAPMTQLLWPPGGSTDTIITIITGTIRRTVLRTQA